jgi:beta-ketodecanoyl-[acyl-carrier-protein] synthase
LQMKRAAITGTGIEIPPHSISNDELVDVFNTWVERENERRNGNGDALLALSNSEFIHYASGVEYRHVIEPTGILDPDRMAPQIPARCDDDVSLEAEFGIASAKKAIEASGLKAEDIDMVICAASHQQRPYPSISIEVQKWLGTTGSAFDMSLGCSSCGAAIHVAASLVRTGAQRRVLITTPEIITGHLNFRDRQTHFIFGDASASVIVEALEDDEVRPGAWEILATRSWTQFSNNIRSNFGFLSRSSQERTDVLEMEGNLIKQVGNKVFKEVTVAASRFMKEFLADNNLAPSEVRRYWLHQANGRMNAMIMKLVLDHDADGDRAPIVLDRLGNTAAAGAIVAFDQHSKDLKAGDYGLICAFGAGYSIGSALIRKM